MHKKNKVPQKDLFGNEIVEDPILREIFIEPPFSILDSKTGNWQRRKKLWKAIGMKSEVGRGKSLTMKIPTGKYKKEDYLSEKNQALNTSIFDPALCEVLYRWFVPDGGRILDPFCGGSVRGIVSNYLGYNYSGIDIREEQIESNRNQALDILEVNRQPQYYVGDSLKVLADFPSEFDFVFSCPPYGDLEVYSDLEGDISNMKYDKFMEAYREIISLACSKLKRDRYACFVVGEIRDKKGNYRGFVPDTIRAFQDAGLNFYNEGILLNAIASASMRAKRQFSAKQKLVKVHQNVLVFRKD